MRIIEDRQEKINFIIQNYSNLGPKKIQEILNCPKSFIQWQVEKHKLFVDKKLLGERLKNRIFNPYKLAINPLDFIHLNSPYHAYIMGFIWGDGSICLKGSTKHIRVQIGYEDGINLKQIFDKTGKWTCIFTKRRKINHKDTLIFCGCGKQLIDYFISLNYNIKSFYSHEKALSTIPDYLQHYWLRGYIDADGCFSRTKDGNKNSFNISSSYNQDWDYMINFFKKLGITVKLNRFINKSGKNSGIEFYKLSYFQLLYQYLYPNGWDNIGLLRKHDKCLEIINSCKRKSFLLTDENLQQQRYS